MIHEKFDFAAQFRTNPNRVDPRIPIARHINWIRPTSANLSTTWRVPEPDNYNHAIRTLRPTVCDFVKDAVFYKDLATNRWWNVFYVPQEQTEDFHAWVQLQDSDFYWFHKRAPTPRNPRNLLYNTPQAEINTEERLFQMGYYAKLGSKYFSEDDKKLLELMGPIRSRVLEGLEEI